jgi:hypothetical protein
MRLALPLAIAALLAGLLAGCGSGSSSSGTSGGGSTAAGEAPEGATPSACGGEAVQVIGVPCATAKAVLAAWHAAPACRVAAGASHGSCQVKGYLCIAARQGEREAVSCALPGKSIIFLPAGQAP